MPGTIFDHHRRRSRPADRCHLEAGLDVRGCEVRGHRARRPGVRHVRAREPELASPSRLVLCCFDFAHTLVSMEEPFRGTSLLRSSWESARRIPPTPSLSVGPKLATKLAKLKLAKADAFEGKRDPRPPVHRHPPSAALTRS